MRFRRFLFVAGALGAAVWCAGGCNRGALPTHLDKIAPNFTLNDGERTVRLSDYHGKVVLLNLWWSNCGPCIEETPGLVALHHERPDVAILGVSVDQDPRSYHRFLERFHVDYTTILDPEQTVAKMYGTDGWPETYIIDRKGVIRRKVVGDPDWSNLEMQAYLQGL